MLSSAEYRLLVASNAEENSGRGTLRPVFALPVGNVEKFKNRGNVMNTFPPNINFHDYSFPHPLHNHPPYPPIHFLCMMITIITIMHLRERFHIMLCNHLCMLQIQNVIIITTAHSTRITYTKCNA